MQNDRTEIFALVITSVGTNPVIEDSERGYVVDGDDRSLVMPIDWAFYVDKETGQVTRLIEQHAYGVLCVEDCVDGNRDNDHRVEAEDAVV